MPKGRYGSKSFDYTRTIRCGECGSSITAEEKFKNLSNGTRKKYIYYLCSKYANRCCEQGPINEINLQEQLIDLMDGVNLDKFILRKEYEIEITKYRRYSNELSDRYQKEAKKQINIRSHMKYIISKGNKEEKKRLLNNLGTKVCLKDKYIYLK